MFYCTSARISCLVIAGKSTDTVSETRKHASETFHRIHIPVENDHCVRGRQVDAHATCARGQQEDKAVRIFVEAVDGLLALVAGNAAVEALAVVLTELAELVDEVDHLHHLGEDQDLQ